MKVAQQEFVFRRHMSIGEPDAESDSKFLDSCFVNNGDFDVICDTDDPKCIVVGRTGAGKSALIEQVISKNENVISIEPEELALNHISNSTIIRFFEGLGVDLDIFYNLLWRHVFTVELIKYKYNINSEGEKKSFIDRMNIFDRDPKKRKALKYIESWGEKFWLDTTVRVQEFTTKLEEQLEAAIKAKHPGVEINAAAVSVLTDEVKSQIVRDSREVVNNVQIKELSEVISLLSDHIFSDHQQKFYIVIDRLDENWVDDTLRYKLIRALIETIKVFRRIRPIKIIVSLRIDLLERVLENTKNSGFQLEKYDNLFLDLRWDKSSLLELLDQRVNSLLRYKYTKSQVGFYDIFPAKIEKQDCLDYMITRTLLRPRDAIMFVNQVLDEAVGRNQLTAEVIKIAERKYSQGRLRSLCDEWLVEYPNLDSYLSILYRKSSSFKVKEMSDTEIDNVIFALLEKGGAEETLVSLAERCLNGKISKVQFRDEFLFILHKIGVVGIKPDGPSPVNWVQNRNWQKNVSKITMVTIIYIHKMLWLALSVDPK